MDDEPDYMSDDFLKISEDNDIRPGLVHSHSKQRLYDMMKRKERATIEQKLQKKNVLSGSLAEDQLQKGLNQPLGPDNKGFSMLQKMGFKPGSSLGLNKTGIVEPVKIELKNNRKGIGRDQALKDIKIKMMKIKECKSQSLNVQDYRASLSQKYRDQDNVRDLIKSQKACYKLDTEAGFDEPEKSWFWPEHMLPDIEANSVENDTDDDHDDCYNTEEKLEILTLFLRKSYLYCIWCCIQYNNETDFNSCPGMTRDDH